jgi:hypothetical protein
MSQSSNQIPTITNTWLMYKSLLDGEGAMCDKKSARFESDTQFAVINYRKDTLQTLHSFRTDDWRAAKSAAKVRPAKSLGNGKFEGDTQTIGQHTLTWTDRETWTRETQSTRVEIEPAVDAEDACQWLDAFLPIQTALFDRKLLRNQKITFKIGGNAYQKNGEGVIAEAMENMSLVKFPAMPDASRIKAVCMEIGSKNEPSPIRLTGIILHEVGHLLERCLSEVIDDLEEWVEKDLHKIEDTLVEISPHCLKFRKENWKRDFAAIERGEPIQINGEKTPARKALVKLKREIAHEIFAEAIRHYFLEPQLHGYQLDPPKTGWEEFDELCWAFCREV